jgi:hypothetical protein
MDTQNPAILTVNPATPPAPDPIAHAILTIIRDYGYHRNPGTLRRQQRALSLLTRRYYCAQDLTLTADGCPVVTRFWVQSESGNSHYHVTKIPNEAGYECTCPDTWHPCKHAYGADLFQAALTLAHTYRLETDAYHRHLQTLPATTRLGSHERTALQVLEHGSDLYDSLAREAARQFYTATKSYAAVCFSRMVDKARRAYGAGYGGDMVGPVGTIRSVLAGRPIIHVRWNATGLRWFVVHTDGSEDLEATDALLHPDIPEWAIARYFEEEADPFPPEACFEAEEEPEGHYRPVLAP